MKTPIHFLLLLVGILSAIPAAAATVAQDSPSSSETRAVILGVHQNHQVEIFDAETLLPLGSIAVNNLASYVGLSRDGQTLFLAAAQTRDANVCCAAFALRLHDGSMCQILYPALGATVLTSSDRVLFQRGNTGIDVFDSRSLAHLPGIRGPGVYNLLPAPDGNWLFGITSFQGPSLDIFSLRENRMVRRLPLPNKLSWDGAWIGPLFYMFGHDGKGGQLWTVQPQESANGPKFCKNEGTCTNRPVEMPDLQNGGKPVAFRVIAAGDSLIAYEPLGWWFKLNRREYNKAFPGGLYKIDPASGKLLAHLATTTDFAQLIANPRQDVLYGLDAGAAYGDHRVRLLKLDAKTGETLLSHPLATDAWKITYAEIPSELVPRGEMQPRACPSQ